MRRVGLIGVAAGIGLVALLAGAAAICKFTTLNCHLREGNIYKGEAGYGTGTTTLPDGFRQRVVASGLELPTSFAFLPDGRILISQKDGLVRVWRDGKLVPRPLIDLRARVDTWSYRGLLKVEPAPDFERTGQLYLFYARERRDADEEDPTTARISKFRVEGDVASPASEEVVLGSAGGVSCNDLPEGSDCIPADAEHVGGDLHFGADGVLWVTTGDGWHGDSGAHPNPLRAQNLDLLAGKLLRVTPEGEGLRDNPFWTGDGRDNRSKVWAFGLRNPFRFSLRPGDDLPFIGNVGWNEWEEIELGLRGANLGWPCSEGPARQEEYAQEPVCRRLNSQPANERLHPVSYESASVTAGAFYTGDSFPSEYRNAYFFGDWSLSVLRWARFDDEGRLVGSVRDFASKAAGPVEIEVGPDGDLYYLATNAGELRRISYEGS